MVGDKKYIVLFLLISFLEFLNVKCMGYFIIDHYSINFFEIKFLTIYFGHNQEIFDYMNLATCDMHILL